MWAGLTIVADLDGTLVSTPRAAHGHYLALSEAPTNRLLQRFIANGGSLCVVSTAGRRLWRQVFHVLRPALASSPAAGGLALCGFGGAAMFVSERTPDGGVEMREVAEYREATCFPHDAVLPLRDLGRAALERVFTLAARDPTYIPLLSRKYHEPFAAIVRQIEEEGGDVAASSPLQLRNLMKHGRYLAETNDALLDAQLVPNHEGITEPMSLASDDARVSATAAVAQFSLLGVPMARFADVFPPEEVEKFARLGATLKAQPNSVVVGRKGVDKSQCVRFLVSSGWRGFALERSIAMGDIPATIDLPLLQHPPMPFVSVALDDAEMPDPARVPTAVVQVGGEELGTALFLSELLRADGEARRAAAELFSADNLAAAAAAAQRRREAAGPDAEALFRELAAEQDR